MGLGSGRAEQEGPGRERGKARTFQDVPRKLPTRCTKPAGLVWKPRASLEGQMDPAGALPPNWGFSGPKKHKPAQKEAKPVQEGKAGGKEFYKRGGPRGVLEGGRPVSQQPGRGAAAGGGHPRAPGAQAPGLRHAHRPGPLTCSSSGVSSGAMSAWGAVAGSIPQPPQTQPARECDGCSAARGRLVHAAPGAAVSSPKGSPSVASSGRKPFAHSPLLSWETGQAGS